MKLAPNDRYICKLEDEIKRLKTSNLELTQKDQDKEVFLETIIEKLNIAESVLKLSPNEVKKALETSEGQFAALSMQAQLNPHPSHSSLKRIQDLSTYLTKVQKYLYRIERLEALSRRDAQSNRRF